jgi:hypothetical protein
MYISCQQHIPKYHEQYIINYVQQSILTGVQILTFSNIFAEYKMSINPSNYIMRIIILINIIKIIITGHVAKAM